jgi:hypothetical protein
VGAPLRLPRCNNFKLAKYLGEGTSRRSRGEILCFCFLGNDAAADHVVDGYPSACGPLFGGAHLTALAFGVSAGETDFAWAVADWTQTSTPGTACAWRRLIFYRLVLVETIRTISGTQPES